MKLTLLLSILSVVLAVSEETITNANTLGTKTTEASNVATDPVIEAGEAYTPGDCLVACHEAVDQKGCLEDCQHMEHLYQTEGDEGLDRHIRATHEAMSTAHDLQ
ncbi:protein of unknown function [Taphrina deformans PYCC 5710]|uniref:Uncharacterized protein n=1 Tax=Taphrina deformans (strain PYCC 5710 / ATCC 11124 / CBS 356.35 / IMI 108563 / JCM 9778 / NBRC 8474) TaxID=1097556 RepID=R4XDC3_TAPDE|nr:protein of unknown function [Taphrina deformans PYCC 5710]|eukprot:CCG83830.1 protein of unknown function [Taphrina deformans PYCC 5710]